MSEIKLLPCPFCWEEAEVKFKFVTYNHDCHRTDFYVRCKVCGAESGDWVNNEVDAINKWNTRKPMQEIVERLGEIKEEREYVAEHTLDLFPDGQVSGLRKAIEIVKEVGGMNE